MLDANAKEFAEQAFRVLERERTGRGSRLAISMTHGSHRLASHRLGGEPLPRLLTGGLACYRTYATADGRWLTPDTEPRP